MIKSITHFCSTVNQKCESNVIHGLLKMSIFEPPLNIQLSNSQIINLINNVIDILDYLKRIKEFRLECKVNESMNAEFPPNVSQSNRIKKIIHQLPKIPKFSKYCSMNVSNIHDYLQRQ